MVDMERGWGTDTGPKPLILVANKPTQIMNLNNVKLKSTGGVNNGRGWTGDVKNMMLDTSKLKSSSWKPKCSAAEALKKTVADLLKSTKYVTQNASLSQKSNRRS